MKSTPKVKDILDKRKISYSLKDTKYGEFIYNCVIFKKIAKITESPFQITIDYPFGDKEKVVLKTLIELEYYLDNEGQL